MSAAHTAEHIFAGSLRKLRSDLTILKVDQSDTQNSIYVNVEILDWATILKAELMTNQIISENRPILEHFFNSLEDAKLKFPSARAMEERISGATRIIEIDGYDYAACSQKHASTTRECDFFLVTRVVKADEGLKINFLVGDIAKQKALALSKITLNISNFLGTSINSLEKTIENMSNDLKNFKSSLSTISEKELDNIPFSNHENITIYSKVFRNLDIKKLMKRTDELIETPSTIVLVANISDKSTIIFSRSSDLTFDSGQILKKVISKYGGKGGGNINFASGNIQEPDIDIAFEYIIDEVFN